MKLQKPAVPWNVTDRIRSICLPPEEDPQVFKGVRCIASGWGQSKHGSKLDPILHQTELSGIIFLLSLTFLFFAQNGKIILRNSSCRKCRL